VNRTPRPVLFTVARAIRPESKTLSAFLQVGFHPIAIRRELALDDI